MYKVIIILLLFPSVCFAWDRPVENRWTAKDTMFEAWNVGLQVIDWGQTKNIVNNPDLYYEGNSFLGKHPSHAEVDRFFLVTIVGHGVVSYLLPRDYREVWQLVTVGMHIGNVKRNYDIGLKVDF